MTERLLFKCPFCFVLVLVVAIMGSLGVMIFPIFYVVQGNYDEWLETLESGSCVVLAEGPEGYNMTVQVSLLVPQNECIDLGLDASCTLTTSDVKFVTGAYPEDYDLGGSYDCLWDPNDSEVLLLDDSEPPPSPFGDALETEMYLTLTFVSLAAAVVCFWTYCYGNGCCSCQDSYSCCGEYGCCSCCGAPFRAFAKCWDDFEFPSFSIQTTSASRYSFGNKSPPATTARSDIMAAKATTQPQEIEFRTVSELEREDRDDDEQELYNSPKLLSPQEVARWKQKLKKQSQ